MAKKIAIFNHKGGVGKTTTTFNLGWILAEKGNKVIVVDADPQCNLTGLVLDYQEVNEFEKFYQENNNNNIRDALAPAFESRPKLIEAVECTKITNRKELDLYLIAGHIKLAEYDVTLGVAQQLSGSIQTLQNLPGSINYLLDKTAKKYDADYILIDMAPSLSSINQNIIMISNYFIVPTFPDFFSLMALDSLSEILFKWYNWAKKAKELELLKDAQYPFPDNSPKFLGYIVQKFTKRNERIVKAFQDWIDKQNKFMEAKFVPSLEKINMILSKHLYENDSEGNKYCLAEIPDFLSLSGKSQDNNTPVFALLEEQINETGIVQDANIKRRDEFKKIYTSIVDKIEKLIEASINAQSNEVVSR